MSHLRLMAGSGSARSAAATLAGSIRRLARSELIPLGTGSSPHGVIQGPDKAAWLTDSGMNAIVRVGWPDRAVRVFKLPDGSRNANLNTATFDGDGDLWFTGQNGAVGKVAVKTGQVTVKEAPRGPYGICTTPVGMCGGVHWRVHTSHASTGAPETRSLSSHRPRTRAPAACGAIARGVSGSANGSAETYRCMTLHRKLVRVEAARRRSTDLCGVRGRA